MPKYKITRNNTHDGKVTLTIKVERPEDLSLAIEDALKWTKVVNAEILPQISSICQGYKECV